MIFNTAEWFLARSYFQRNRKSGGFLSFIKIMAIGGVAIGAGGLLIALAIAHGFSQVIHQKLYEFGAHIRIETYGAHNVYRADTLKTYLLNKEHIVTAEEAINRQVLVQSKFQTDGAFVQSVTDSPHYSYIKTYIQKGSFDLGSDKKGLMLGTRLARLLEVDVGDRLTLFALEESGAGSRERPNIFQGNVTGIYDTGIEEIDGVLILMSLSQARQLFSLGSTEATTVEMRVDNPVELQRIDAQLNKSDIFPFYTQTIREQYRNIFAWVNLQENTIPFVISAMVIISAFNLIGTILMMVLERTKDIGILKTLGMSAKGIQRIFMLEGLLVAVWGIFFGILLFGAFYGLEGTFHFIRLPEENYYMNTTPIQPFAIDFVIVPVVTFLLCALASWIPARVGARISPVKSIGFVK